MSRYQFGLIVDLTEAQMVAAEADNTGMDKAATYVRAAAVVLNRALIDVQEQRDELLTALEDLFASVPVPSSACKERPAWEAARAAITKVLSDQG